MAVRMRNRDTGVVVEVDEATAAALGPRYEPDKKRAPEPNPKPRRTRR